MKTVFSLKAHVILFHLAHTKKFRTTPKTRQKTANQTGKERIDIVLQSDYTPYYKEAAAQGRPLLPHRAVIRPKYIQPTGGQHSMKKKRIVIALGHHALGTTLPEQKIATVKTAKAIAGFIKNDYQVVITHGNGPQVGMIHMAMAEFCRIYPEYTSTPMSVCSAMSQGYIGYDLQNAIRAELLGRGIYKPVSTVLTQVVVDPYDDAFYHPTKIIGRVMSAEEAQAEENKGNYVVKAEGGYRRIIAAPKPIDIIEIESVRALLDADQIVIACGGGGIPVLQQANNLKGASAVIEKDLAAAKLADLVDAQTLVILTGVEKACLHYGTPQEKVLDELTTAQAAKYLEEGQFEAGSMEPKIQAAISFIGNSAIRRTIITKLDSDNLDLAEPKGTVIRK